MKFVSCPICSGEARVVLEQMLVSASFAGQTREFGGMLVYQCAANQHIFFVGRRDIEDMMDSYEDDRVVLMKEPRMRKAWGG